MTAVGPEDIRAMREQGDLTDFLLGLAGRPPTKPAPAAGKPRPDIHREQPGAWPTGSSRPAPPAPIPGHAAQAALDDYRRWYLAGRPPAPAACPCSTCRRRKGDQTA
ncbi:MULTISPECIES: hypothetical protein [Streptomyces]|uniref:hypothetical protein n=1 Tax=Streptomyces TaxID=1883 RepID=UPI0005194F71|nr:MULTISPECIES: hypothetical protein [Streptomyces]KOT49943.1 hypothetical protein ADK43_35085 [Streptomyces rimosus subsp. rimosus]